MKLACHILAYNVDRFIDHTLENCADHVDKIYIAYPARPWDYTPSSRANKTNPTSRARVQQAINRLATLGKSVAVDVIEGDWEKDHDTRNACLAKAKAEGFDWLIIQDADEFYSRSSWEMLRAALLRLPHADRIITPWYNFWKTPDNVVVMRDGSIKDYNVGFALRCRDGVSFIRARTSSPSESVVIDAPCYHYGYVMSDEEMYEKISTWGHSHQFNRERWFRHKWLNWTPSTRLLHPVLPTLWQRAQRFPNEQPSFALEFILPQTRRPQLSLADFVGNAMWDAKASARSWVRETRAMLSAGFSR